MKTMTKIDLMRIANDLESEAMQVAYDKVVDIIDEKLGRIMNLLTSEEAYNILQLSQGDKFTRLMEKRQELRSQYNALNQLWIKIYTLKDELTK